LPLLLASLAGCDLFPAISPGEGNLRVTVSGGGRAVDGTLLSYHFSFSGPGGETITRSLEPPATTLVLTVATGLWTIHTEAFAAAGSLYGSGDTSVTVTTSGAAAVISMGKTGPLLASVAAAAAWIADAGTIDSDDAGGLTVTDPIPLRMGLVLSSANWANLLSEITTADKFVALDLSACTADTHIAGGGLYSGGTFDPDHANTSTGKGKIVSLVLPTAATSIIASASYSNAAFNNFTKLKSVSGVNIETVGDYAFIWRDTLSSVILPSATTIGTFALGHCTSLSSVSLPLAITIGDNAFYNCTSLSLVSLPQATSIGNQAFHNCTSLSSVSLPLASSIGSSAFASCINLSLVSLPLASSIGDSAFMNCNTLSSVSLPASSIGNYAFYGCTGLSSVDLPSASSIGEMAFFGCGSLSSVNLPLATSIGKIAFYECTTLSTLTLPATPPALVGLGSDGAFVGTNRDAGAGTTLTIQVPSGAVGNYTSTTAPGWGVSVDTAASGNDTKYGSSHKRVVISDDTLMFTTTTDITTYLSSAPEGDSAADPVPLRMGLELSSTNWAALLSIINTADKFVALDLAACNRGPDSAVGSLYVDGTFDPNSSSNIGKGKIASLVLPTAATSIAADTSSGSNPTFQHFTALKSVSGANILTIGDYAFSNCANLSSADLPSATNIGSEAFNTTSSEGNLTVTLGSTAPDLESGIFYGSPSKTVIVKVPSDATGYGASPTNTTDECWGNGFRGGGWNGSAMTFPSYVNGDITLYIIEE
jgi:hypothetical protein